MHKHVQSKSSKTDVTAPQSNKVLGIQSECIVHPLLVPWQENFGIQLHNQ